VIPTTELNLFLEPEGKGALYVRVAEAVLAAVRAGRIAPGAPLPGIRELGAKFGVHRNTVLVAMRELEAQGWLEARPRLGFYVVHRLPEGPARTHAAPARPPSGILGFDVSSPLAPVTDTRNQLRDFSDGVADGRLVPIEAMAQAYLRGLRLRGPELLQSSEFKGLQRLRNVLAEHLAQRRALTLGPEQLLIVRSTSMAVSLVAQAIIGPGGGSVAVEDPGNPAVWATLGQASPSTLVPIPVDQDGLRTEVLEAHLRRSPIQLLVLTPQCHYPTGVSLAPERRRQVLDLATRHRFPILELDPEFDYLRRGLDSQPPLAAQDTTGQVIYAGSLSRVLAPGLRLGYLGLPATLADKMARARQRLDWQGDPLQEWVISELFLDGDFRRHLRRLRKAFLERREALMDALRHSLGDRVAFHEGHGGMALWLTGAGDWKDSIKFDLWVLACAQKGFKLRQGKWFTLDGRSLSATRFGFTAYRPEEIQEAVALMG
jgi:GntR family transcriptional regulator/MocR family aminotransferase